MKQPKQSQIKRFLFSLTLLLENGFELKESIQIMQRSQQISNAIFIQFTKGLSKGASIAEAFRQLGCSEKEVTQIDFALMHGNLASTLRTVVNQRTQREKQLVLFRKASVYPAFLLIIICFVLLVLRQYLLPQLLAAGLLESGYWGVRFILQLPIYLGISALIIGMIVLGLRYSKRVHSPLQQAVWFSKLPIFGTFYRLYQTSYFTLEWGNLYKQGLESKQIVSCMLRLSNRTLMYEIAKQMEQRFTKGESFAQMIDQYPFLAPELAVIIYQGEQAGRLGDELLLYSRLSLQNFSERLERFFHWLQPILFLLVAALVISIYAAMFIPLYQNMGGDFL